MKGVILAGGRGTRLHPVTRGINKHSIPIYDKPMISYPVQTLVDAGILEILIITSAEAIGPLSKQLGSGKEFITKSGKQIQILYGIQNEPLGVGHALWISRFFAGGEDIAVVLGDNIIEDNISTAIKGFKGGAEIFIKEVEDPKSYGVVELNGNRVISLEEKPENPKSNLAAVGLYLYDNTVFEKIDKIQPSWRNELEITDVNREYLLENKLNSRMLNGYWFDAGTFEGFMKISNLIYDNSKKK